MLTAGVNFLFLSVLMVEIAPVDWDCERDSAAGNLQAVVERQQRGKMLLNPCPSRRPQPSWADDPTQPAHAGGGARETPESPGGGA